MQIEKLVNHPFRLKTTEATRKARKLKHRKKHYGREKWRTRQAHAFGSWKWWYREAGTGPEKRTAKKTNHYKSWKEPVEYGTWFGLPGSYRFISPCTERHLFSSFPLRPSVINIRSIWRSQIISLLPLQRHREAAWSMLLLCFSGLFCGFSLRPGRHYH